LGGEMLMGVVLLLSSGIGGSFLVSFSFLPPLHSTCYFLLSPAFCFAGLLGLF
jgi:hypothetical protein